MKKSLLILVVVIIVVAVVVFSLQPDRFGQVIQFLNSLGILPYLIVALLILAIPISRRK